MRYRILMAGALALGIFVGGETGAAELKLAFVDVKSAIENTKDYREGLQRLEGIKKTKQKELGALRDRIAKMEKDLFSQSMAMSPERLSRKQQGLNDLKKDFKRKQQDAQEMLLLEKTRLNRGIFKKFYDVVRNYGKKQGYDMILPKSSVLFGSSSHDVTAQVTKLLDSSK